MAAPTPTVRQVPAGIPLYDGFKCLTTFARSPAVSFWEKSNKIPGMDGGEAIKLSTMHNTAVDTFAPRALKTMTPKTVKAAFDPNFINQAFSLVNVPDTITDRMSDGSTLCYYGYLRQIEFDDMVEGTMPECTITIVPTNWDPVNKVEALPVLTSVAGT